MPNKHPLHKSLSTLSKGPAHPAPHNGHGHDGHHEKFPEAVVSREDFDNSSLILPAFR